MHFALRNERLSNGTNDAIAADMIDFDGAAAAAAAAAAMVPCMVQMVLACVWLSPVCVC